MDYSDIKWLHVEPTSRCNAWCPSCSRNCNGYGLADGVIEADLSLDQYEEILSMFPNVETIQLCGNFGDPIIHKDLIKMVEISLAHNVVSFQVHTNGSARTKEWWAELATVLNKAGKHDVIFGIDGSKETNHLYRQATNWDKIMENAEAFINAGGYASWQFIPFEHNLHEEKDLEQLAKDMGFRRFFRHRARIKKTPPRNWRTGEQYELKSIYKTTMYQEKDEVLEENCMHLSIPSMYVNSLGKIAPCCYLHDHVQYFANNKYNDIRTQILSNSIPRCINACGTKKSES